MLEESQIRWRNKLRRETQIENYSKLIISSWINICEIDKFIISISYQGYYSSTGYKAPFIANPLQQPVLSDCPKLLLDKYI